MRERYHRTANILGIRVSVIRVDRAVNISVDLMRKKGMSVICFLSAEGSLLCQNDETAASYIQSCQLVLPGDRHIEMASHHHQETGTLPEGMGEFADNYLKRLFTKISKDKGSIYTIMEQEDHLNSLETYMDELYPNIEVRGSVLVEGTKEESDKAVNQINACIPDIVFVCLSPEHQIQFMKNHAAMMNTGLCILVESIQPLIRKETEEVPGIFRAFRLEKLYAWFKREHKIRKTIVGSLFKKKVLDEGVEEKPEEKPDALDDRERNTTENKGDPS